MKNEVAKRREHDPSFAYRKLKDELYGRGSYVGNSNGTEGSENGSNETYRKVKNVESIVQVLISIFLLHTNHNRVQKERRVKVMRCLVF